MKRDRGESEARTHRKLRGHRSSFQSASSMSPSSMAERSSFQSAAAAAISPAPQAFQRRGFGGMQSARGDEWECSQWSGLEGAVRRRGEGVRALK